jgi:ADP-ribose pyrophosphatase
METWIDKQIVFSGKVFSVVSGKVRLDDGNETRRDVVGHNGGTALVPILGDKIVLIRKFRISIGRELLELPAGRLEIDETPENCARREIEEELGLRADRLVLVHTYYSSVGFTNERMYIYLALDLQEVEKHLEWDERIQIVRVPIAEIESKVRNGEFEDSKTIIGLYAALAYMGLNNKTQSGLAPTPGDNGFATDEST